MLLSTHIRAIKQDGWFPSPPMVGIYLNTAYAVVFYSLYTMHMPRIPPLQGRISPYTDFIAQTYRLRFVRFMVQISVAIPAG